MIAYRNNLVKGDAVQHAETRRRGKVATTPREKSRQTAVVWEGTNSARYEDVSDLRLVINGVPEEVAPVDGEVPAREAPSVRVPPANGAKFGALTALEAEREDIADEMTELEGRFKYLKARREQLDRAIAVLTGPPPS